MKNKIGLVVERSSI